MDQLLTQRNLGILAVVLLLAGAGIYFAEQMSDKKEQEGRSALYQIQKTFEDEEKALPESDRAVGVSLDVDAKFPKSVAELKGMIQAKTASTRVLFEAAIRLGTLYLNHGKINDAIAQFKVATQFANSSFQKATAAYILAGAEEQANQLKEANGTLVEALGRGDDRLNPQILLGLIRTASKLKDVGKAKLYSEKLNHDYKDSSAAQAASVWVKE